MTYVVMPSDSLYTIAQKYNTTVERLIALNNITNPNDIMVGRILIISPQAPVSRPPIEADWCPRLTLGSRGNAVRRLQNLLKERGFDLGDSDGVFGARTRGAVINFQRSRRLPVTGVVDIATWEALGIDCRRPGVSVCPTIRLGSRGSAVRFVQSLLRNLNYAPGPIDGVYGEDTQGAVFAFQRNNNLPLTGVVDQATWNALGVTCVPTFPEIGVPGVPGLPVLPPEEGAELNYNWQEIDGFRYLLATNEKAYFPGQRVRITFRKRNITNETVTLRYPSTQLFDFYISNENGREIWRWSETKKFQGTTNQIILPPGRAETIEISWNQTNKQGNLVRPQTFTLWGTNKGTGETISLKFVVSRTSYQG